MGKNRSAVAPTLSYRKTISLYLVTQDGDICTVEDCPAGAFGVLVQVCAQTAQDLKAAEMALAGLDYRSTIDRWYAVNALTEYGAALPLFTTRAEVRQLQQVAV